MPLQKLLICHTFQIRFANCIYYFFFTFYTICSDCSRTLKKLVYLLKYTTAAIQLILLYNILIDSVKLPSCLNE